MTRPIAIQMISRTQVVARQAGHQARSATSADRIGTTGTHGVRNGRGSSGRVLPQDDDPDATR